MRHVEGNDYEFERDEYSVWITVNGYSVYIVNHYETRNVQVRAFKLGEEHHAPLFSFQLPVE